MKARTTFTPWCWAARRRESRRFSDRRCGLAVCLALAGGLGIAHGAAAAPKPHEVPRAYCARVGTDDTLRTPPAALAGAIRRVFNISGAMALKATYYRCAAGKVLVCWIGANLPCGKADTSKTLPAASRWCRTHPDADFIPLYVTGHDSIYSWRCRGTAAHAGAPVARLDDRGFFAAYWKKL